MRRGAVTWMVGAGFGGSTENGVFLTGATSIGWTASVATMRNPVLPPFDNGAMDSASHCGSSSAVCTELGREAHATPLHRKARRPALFQLTRGIASVRACAPLV